MSVDNPFLLEKYKYILARKQALNEATFKIAATYQTLVIALGVAEYTIISQLNEKKINIALATYATLTTYTLLSILTSFVILLLAGGVKSWLKYRKDEALVELEAMGKTKEPVKPIDIFRWYETYIILVVLIIFIVSTWSLKATLLPLIKSLA